MDNEEKKLIEEVLNDNEDTSKEIVADPEEITAEAFYAQGDSAYIRIQWLEDKQGFRFSVRNQIVYDISEREGPEAEVPHGAVALGTLIRGLCELGITQTDAVYMLGKEAQKRDYFHMLTEDLSNEEKVLLSKPKGNA